MPLPSPLVGLTVRAKLLAADSTPLVGVTITLTPTVPATSPAGDVLLAATPLSKVTAADGTVEWTNVLATDSPGLSNRVPYTVTIAGGAVVSQLYTVELLASAAVGGVLRLDDVAPASAPNVLTAYILASLLGAVGGPAGPLDADGKVLVGQLPAAGGSIAVTLVDAKGDLIAGTGPDAVARLAAGADGRVLMADAAQAAGLKWQALGIADIASLQTALDGKIPITLEDAKGDLLVGTANDTVGRLAVGTDGQVLTADSAQSSGLKWAPSATGVVYPLQEGYGFHSASVLPDNAKAGAGGWGAWHTRIWVPADKVISKAGIFITTAAAGTATLAAFAVYADDGQTLLGSTAHDNNLFLSTGLRQANLTSPIAAQATGRFVRALVTSNYSTSGPSAMFTEAGTGDAYNGGTGIRTAFLSALSSFPASFNPTTGAGLSGWTPSSFLPIILIG